MSYRSRLDRSFEGAPRLPLNHRTKYVFISDCHRGTGTTNDNFLKNQHLYFAALQHYYQTGFTYIELGDGDELWENRSLGQIIETHGNVFELLSQFQKQNRLYMLYGNHDIVKQSGRYTARNCTTFPCGCGNNPHREQKPLLPDIKFYPGIILENQTRPNARNIYLTHGHQADFFNSVLWPLSRFLVRYVWKPLERYGVLDPTSAAKNYTRKHRTEQRLHRYAGEKGVTLITGHTHRPALPDDKRYFNSGSCVHPRCITCLEIEHMRIRLVKWTMTVHSDMSLYVACEQLAGPASLE